MKGHWSCNPGWRGVSLSGKCIETVRPRHHCAIRDPSPSGQQASSPGRSRSEKTSIRTGSNHPRRRSILINRFQDRSYACWSAPHGPGANRATSLARRASRCFFKNRLVDRCHRPWQSRAPMTTASYSSMLRTSQLHCRSTTTSRSLKALAISAATSQVAGRFVAQTTRQFRNGPPRDCHLIFCVSGGCKGRAECHAAGCRGSSDQGPANALSWRDVLLRDFCLRGRSGR